MDNLNSEQYWDEIYKSERGTGKRRIDNDRLGYLVGEMKNFQSTHPHEGTYRLLDVGCGNGELMRLLHAEMPEWKLFGVDITPETIAWASQIDPNFDYRKMSALDLTFSEGYFDIVFCGETLEHLESPEAAIYQMKRVLKPEGYLICSVPNEGNNRSPEHLREFTVWDALKLTDTDMSKITNLNVKCNGISTIWTWLK
jgi:2-polyprenyl-3-methyl-5-hydroxy-6-metoxy-1,4-benzoquinol methylase